jgi:nucleoside-diphosphate-sugar epimerase
LNVIVLGSEGFLGSSLSTKLQSCGNNVFQINRSIVNFGGGNEAESLSQLIEQFCPDIVINAVGQIDLQEEATINSLFNSIFLPTALLFRHFQDKGSVTGVKVLTFGSESEGQPRGRYPLYAALKTAEASLVLTAADYFSKTNISWPRLKLPRLNGGLGSVEAPNETSTGTKSIDMVWDEVKEILGITEDLGR